MAEPFLPASDFEPPWATRLSLKLDDVTRRIGSVEDRMTALEKDFLQKWSTRQKLITVGASIGTGLGTLLLSKVPALAPLLQGLGDLLKGLG